MHTMSDSERTVRATVKVLHASIRAELRAAHLAGGSRHRYAILAWAFVRELPCRRFERSHHCQTQSDGSVFEHNLPSVTELARALAPFFPEIAAELPKERWGWIRSDSPTAVRLGTWLTDPSGAIPAPAPRAKKRFVRPVAELQAAE